MTNRGKANLVAKIYLINKVYAFNLGVFRWITFFPNLLTTRLLVPIPSIILALSILYLLASLML